MYEVVIARDADSGQYYVHDSDIIGLQACADTVEGLIAIIEDVAPELIAFNHKPRKSVLSRVLSLLAREPRQYQVRVSQDLCLAA